MTRLTVQETRELLAFLPILKEQGKIPDTNKFCLLRFALRSLLTSLKKAYPTVLPLPLEAVVGDQVRTYEEKTKKSG